MNLVEHADPHSAGTDPVIPSGTVLVQLTDLHIGPPGTAPYGTDTAANLRRTAATIREMDLRPAAVLLTGDLCDKGEPEAYELLRTIVAEELEPLGAPVLTVVGNHDHRGSFRRAYLGEPDADDGTPWYHVTDLDGHDDPVRVVMLDSYIAGRATGRLGDEQLAWLDRQLGEAGDRTAVVALHHPSVPRGVPRPTDFLLEDRREFADVIASHRVAAVLVGHSHVSTCAWWAGTVHAAAPSTAYLLDPSVRRGGKAHAGSGFSICTVREGRAVVNPYIVPVDPVVLYDHRPVAAAAAAH